MAIKSVVLGPGTLTIGAGPLDFSAQLSACAVKWSENVDKDDDFDALSGETEKGLEHATYDATLTGTLRQDIDAAGCVAYSWTNKGTEQPFVFVPNTATARQVTGTVRVMPIDLGGDVKKKNTSDFVMAIIGDPNLGDVA